MAKVYSLMLIGSLIAVVSVIGALSLRTATMGNTCRSTDNPGLCMLDYQAHGDVRAAIAAGNRRQGR